MHEVKDVKKRATRCAFYSEDLSCGDQSRLAIVKFKAVFNNHGILSVLAV